MIELTAFQQLILLDVAIREHTREEKPHGLAIKEDLSEMYREAGELEAGEEINHGRLYPNLDTLVDAGLLEKGEQDKRTNWYALTDAGAESINRYARLVHIAQGKDGANPYVPAGHDVDGQPAPADD